ncbi:MAG: AI-2E family transporter [Vulcanimicrobiaceae bacterium]
MTNANSPPPDATTAKLTRILLALGIIALSIALLTYVLRILGATPGLVLIIVFAVLLVYLIAPVVGFLKRFMPKHFAVLITFVVLIALIFGFGAIVLPPLVSQAQGFIASIPGATLKAQTAINDPNNQLFRGLPQSIRDELAAAPQRFFDVMRKYALVIGQQGLAAIFSAFSLFLTIIIIPVLALYLIFDYRELERGIIGFFPPHERERAVAIIHDLSNVMGAFVRGQMLDGLCVGFMIWLLLAILHVPFALVIAVAAGVLNLIPYAGAIVGFIPSVLVALAYNGWENALIVAIGFIVIQQIDGDFIVPRIMNASVKLSPVVIIIAIVGFGSLFGLLGALMAVPVAAMLRVFKLHFSPSPSDEEFEQLQLAAQGQEKFK